MIAQPIKRLKFFASLSENHKEIHAVRHEKNSGKTEALKTGFRLTRGDIVIVQDADLEYAPEEIPSVIAPILDGHADVVFGSRFLVKKATRVLYFYHYLGNKLLTFLSNLATNINLTDVETCYKAFRGDIIRQMRIKSSGFGFEIEVTAKVAKLKCSIYETPISYYGRTYEEGKKITAWDGVAAVYYILRYNFFCSLKKSYYRMPQFGSQRNRRQTYSSCCSQFPRRDSHERNGCAPARRSFVEALPSGPEMHSIITARPAFILDCC